MKKSIMVVLMMTMIVLGAVSTSIAEEKKFLISLGGGVFMPGGDASDYNQGTNVSLSGTWTAGDIFAFGMDINHNKIDLSQTLYSGLSSGVYTSEITTTSLEFLVYIQPNTGMKVQPYLGIGLGEYFNTVTNKWRGATLFEDDGAGIGFVAKGGVRGFIGDKFFIGAYAKYFTNSQDIIYYSSTGTSTKTYDLGGTVVNAEIGVRF